MGSPQQPLLTPPIHLSDRARWSENRGPLQTEVVPDWRNFTLTWAELQEIPGSWRDALRQWRGIYYIFDKQKIQGYVGSAYGRKNILRRWLDYRTTSHGGNQKLKACNPNNFQFSILELLTHDSPKEGVIDRESEWKKRLHTREHGLNDN